MKKQLLLTLALGLMLSFTQAQTRETRNVDTFTKISYRIPGKLYLRQGSPQKVELEGRKEILDKLEVEVDGGRLVIGREGRWQSWRWKDGDDVNVYITVKDIDAVMLNGSGDIIGETKLVGDNIELNVSGSGNMKLEVEASGDLESDLSGSGNIHLKGKSNSFNSDVSGSGNLTLTMNVTHTADFGVAGSGKIEADGSAGNVKASISGSGKVLAADFTTSKCDVHITGSGDVEINVREELDATISGSGSVSYKGNPSKINSHSSGSGHVHKM